jgi:hypothetical protein
VIFENSPLNNRCEGSAPLGLINEKMNESRDMVYSSSELHSLELKPPNKKPSVVWNKQIVGFWPSHLS